MNHQLKTVVINMHKTVAIYTQINIAAVKVARLLNPLKLLCCNKNRVTQGHFLSPVVCCEIPICAEATCKWQRAFGITQCNCSFTVPVWCSDECKAGLWVLVGLFFRFGFSFFAFTSGVFETLQLKTQFHKEKLWCYSAYNHVASWSILAVDNAGFGTFSFWEKHHPSTKQLKFLIHVLFY